MSHALFDFFCLQLVTRIFKDDIELETYITSAHYAVCSDVRYVLFFVRAAKKAISSLALCPLQTFLYMSSECLSVWSLDWLAFFELW